MKYFSENWDGIKRKAVDEAKDPTAKDIKALRLSSEKGKTKQGKNANIMTAKDDPIKESTVSEAANFGDHWTDLDKMAENILKEKSKVAWVGKFDVASYLVQIAGSLKKKHGQQNDFLDGLLIHLEGVHRKLMSPSKHGNIEIMHDLAKIILELKKYQN